MSSIFPFSENIEIEGKTYSYSSVISTLEDETSPERRAKIQNVCAKRFSKTQIITENIHDIGNINAVMRSAENLGFLSMHNIQAQSMKYSSRITQGAHKWLKIENYKDTDSCMKKLKEQGVQVVCTRLSERAIELDEVDFSIPTAVVFGNEKRGVTEEMLKYSDVDCMIPSYGFSQSFNISVAAAIVLYHIRYKYGRDEKLDSKQQEILKAHYMLRSCKSPHLYFK